MVRDEPAVSCRRLGRWHGRHLALAEVDLDIPRGSRHGIIGANGAGKTTFMRMLSTTLLPSVGTLRVLGKDVVAEPRAIKARIGVVPQGMTYDSELRVRENLTTFARYHGLDARAARRRANELLELVQLSDCAEAPPDQLSGGMQRRLLLARALVNEPDLVLLDEPTTGLDPEGRRIVWDRLGDLCAGGTTLVFTTHYLEEVDRQCDSVTVLHRGRVLSSGTPRHLVHSTVGPWVADMPAFQLPERARGGGVIPVGDRLLIFADDQANVTSAARRLGHLDVEVQVRPSTLEDALHALQQSHQAGAERTAATTEPPLSAPGRPRRPPSLKLAVHVWQRNLTLFRRAYKTTIVPNFFEPVFSLLALGLGLGSYIDNAALGGTYPDFIAPGLLALSAANGATFEVTYNIFVRLRHARSYTAVVTTPVEPQDIALGELLWALTRCFVYTLIFVSMVAALGLAPAPTAFLAPVALLLLGLVLGCLGMLFTSTVRTINAYSYFYTLMLTPLTVLSGIFFPVDRFPEPLRSAVLANPLYHGVELARALVTTGHLSDAILHAAWLAVAGGLLVTPALYSLRRHLTS